MKLPALLLSLLTSVFLTGCLQIERNVRVKPDGSGTIEETMIMGKEMLAQMKQMEAAFGGNKDAGAKAHPSSTYDETKLKAQAAKLGEGVTFVSGKPMSTATGEGYSAIYAFKDVTKLRIEAEASGVTPAGAGEMKASGKNGPIVFGFTKGKTAELTIQQPTPKTPATPAAAPDPADAATAGMEEAMLPMMQQMLKGMRMALHVQVEGKIVDTNAEYRDGAKVTLMDVDFDKLLAKPETLKAMVKSKAKSINEQKALIKGIEGVRVESAEQVKIRFQ